MTVTLSIFKGTINARKMSINYPSVTVDNRTDLSARWWIRNVEKLRTIVTARRERIFLFQIDRDRQQGEARTRVVPFQIIESSSRAIYDGVYFRKWSHSGPLKISKKRRVTAMLLRRLLLFLIDRAEPRLRAFLRDDVRNCRFYFNVAEVKVETTARIRKEIFF